MLSFYSLNILSKKTFPDLIGFLVLPRLDSASAIPLLAARNMLS